VINFFGKRNFMLPMGRPKHTQNVPCIFFLLSLGGGGFRGGYFSSFHASIMLTIPHHPLTLAGPSRERGGGVGGGLEPITNYRIKPPTPISL